MQATLHAWKHAEQAGVNNYGSLEACLHPKIKIYIRLPNVPPIHCVRTFTAYSIRRLWGLLDRPTARYFYKRLKTCLHKPTGYF